MRNYGQHNAVLCGIRAVRGDDTQLVPTGRHLLRFTAEVVSPALEPPKHVCPLPFRSGSSRTLRRQRFVISQLDDGLVGLQVLLVALDGEQELMKLPPDAPLRPTIVQVLKRPLEAPKCPPQRNFGILVHVVLDSRVTKFHAGLLLHGLAHAGTTLMCADGTRQNNSES